MRGRSAKRRWRKPARSPIRFFGMDEGGVVELVLSAGKPATRRAEPVGCGLPWPRGHLADVALLRLEDAAGRVVPVQASALDRWGDGSVRWALARWMAAVEDQAVYRLRIAPGPAPSGPVPVDSLGVEPVASGFRVRAGGREFVFSAGAEFPFSVRRGDQPVLLEEESRFRVFDSRGRIAAARIETIELEEAGPLHARLRVQYALDEPLRRVLRVSGRLSFFAGSAVVRFDLTLHNPRRAHHPGGFWELGDPGSFLFRGASVRLALAEPVRDGVRCSLEPGKPEVAFGLPFGLLQESSGSEGWKSRVHVNREGVVPFRFRGYRLRAGGDEQLGHRAEPIVSLGPVAVAFPKFWQSFPKGIGADEKGLTIHLFPEDAADLHELQGGEQKTHTFFVAFGPDEITDAPLAWCHDPVHVRARPEWYAASGAVPHLAPLPRSSDPEHEALLHAAIEGPASFFAKRERIDEYGWRHFGDLYADHETVFHEGSEPLVSHYNNQYDAIAGFAAQFLRSDDFRWWQLMDELARHVADIDVYRTDEDKAAYNHGLFWHTQHYVDAGKSTHRCYPRAPGIHGGGPSNEHNYTTGLVLHHFLTGDPLSRETAVELAQWVLDMDDGNRTVFRWIARGPTGLASSTTDFAYHGPGRGAGNSINALLDAFQLTRKRRFLDKAEELLRRCVHPRDDVDARGLADAERRWSYVVFLQKLGRYLDFKTELGEVDAMHAYARAVLLHYARWMVAHERPFLDRPEILEYPTETWAAQDLRKADVFALAAIHVADGDERRSLLERASFFFRHSLDTLGTMETRTLTRPLVIALTNGQTARAVLRSVSGSLPSLAQADGPLPLPVRFEPQKSIALRRVRGLAWGASLLAAAAGAGMLFLG